MQSRDSKFVQLVLRRSLAVIECAAAVALLLQGYDLLGARRVGGDGIATGIARLFGGFSILIGLGVALAAVMAWLGRRRWWVWQAGMLAWAVALPVGTFLVVMIFSLLFGGTP